MSSPISEEYVRPGNSEFDHKIVLIVDNCPAHSAGLSFKNIEFIFFPANNISLIQPLEQGINSSFKTLYRSKVSIYKYSICKLRENLIR